MPINIIEQDFMAKVSPKVRLSADGEERFRVFTPFMFEDGDQLVIVLKKVGSQWILTDEAHTYMHLTYEIDEKALHSGTRGEIISRALSMFEVEDRNGELILEVQDEDYGDALYSFVQTLLKIIDVSYLSRPRVQSTFMEDFRSLLNENVPASRISFDWHHPVHDPEGMYTVDCRINGMPEPLLVHALGNDDRVQNATIVLLQFRAWEIPFRSLAIFKNQQGTNRKDLARFNAVSEKQFPSLDECRGDIEAYLHKTILNTSQNAPINNNILNSF